MSLDKISVTLYDLLGYLLPGYVLLLGAAVVEATLLKTSLFSLTGFTNNALPYAVVAYFLGQFGHALGSFFKEWSASHAKRLEASMGAQPAPRPLKKWMLSFLVRQLRPKTTSLTRPLFDQVFNEVAAAYDLQPEQLQENKTLNVFLLCDNWVLASGGSSEREILQAREGFFKASTVAFLLLGLILIGSVFGGGAKINQTPDIIKLLSPTFSLSLGLACCWFASICWKRHYFFGCVKRTTIMLLFLALRKTKKVAVPTTPPTQP